MLNKLKQFFYNLLPKRPVPVFYKSFDVYNDSRLWSHAGGSIAGVEQATQFDYYNASEEGYKQVIWAYRCIREVANRVSSVPWAVFKKNKNGEAEEIENHPLKELLLTPNPYMSWKDYLELWVIFMYVSGNHYMLLDRPERPTELFALRPDRVKIIPGADGNVQIYKYKINSNEIDVEPEYIVHFKFPDPTDDYYGLSPLYVSAWSLETELDVAKWNRNLIRNGARPGGMLIAPQDMILTADQRDEFKTALQSWQGAENAGKPIILEGGFEWTRAQLTQSEADYEQLKRLTREEICAAIGVPPVIVGILDHATYSNFEQAEQSFWSQTIMPALRKFRDQFNVSVSHGFGDDIYIDYILDDVEVLREDQGLLHDRARQDFHAGLITQNEARQQIGYKPVDGGEVFIISGSFQVIGGNDADQINPPQETQEEPQDRTQQEEDGIEEEESNSAKDYRVKIVNLRSARAKQQFKNNFQRRRDKWTGAVRTEAKKILTAQYQEVARNYRKTGDNIAIIWDRYKYEYLKDWQTFYQAMYEEVIDDFGRYSEIAFMRGLAGKLYIPRKARDPETRFDVLDGFVQNYIRDEIAEKIVQVSETTKKQVKAVIWEGYRDGMTIGEIADKILEMEEIQSRLRADMIAATEVVVTSNAGSYLSINQVRDLFRWDSKAITKTWESAGDERVRLSHQAADGQTVPLDSPFVLSGGELLFPGDSSLGVGAEEIIGCRCVHSYNTAGIGGIITPGSDIDNIVRPYL